MGFLKHIFISSSKTLNFSWVMNLWLQASVSPLETLQQSNDRACVDFVLWIFDLSKYSSSPILKGHFISSAQTRMANVLDLNERKGDKSSTKSQDFESHSSAKEERYSLMVHVKGTYDSTAPLKTQEVNTCC